MERKLIYIINEESENSYRMKLLLQSENYCIETFYDGDSLYNTFLQIPSDMIILDVFTPKVNGIDLCSKIREKSMVPIIFVTSCCDERIKIQALLSGGDDYVTIPYSSKEFTARVDNLFRRVLSKCTIGYEDRPIIIGDLYINPRMKNIEFDGKSIGLTLKEYSVFLYLAVNNNRVISRKEFLQKIWGFKDEVYTRAVDDMIKRIRKKLVLSGSSLKIETIRGYGFSIHI